MPNVLFGKSSVIFQGPSNIKKEYRTNQKIEGGEIIDHQFFNSMGQSNILVHMIGVKVKRIK
jgi:hypothetical protein